MLILLIIDLGACDLLKFNDDVSLRFFYFFVFLDLPLIAGMVEKSLFLFRATRPNKTKQVGWKTTNAKDGIYRSRDFSGCDGRSPALSPLSLSLSPSLCSSHFPHLSSWSIPTLVLVCYLVIGERDRLVCRPVISRSRLVASYGCVFDSFDVSEFRYF